MTACDSSIRVRIDSETKQKASEVLSQMGLSISDAVRMTLVQIGTSGRLPFPVEIPNAKTRQAMAEVASGEGEEFQSLDDLYEDLGI
ncbi:type II toxin-antitoxin system RelB/DinJ family antitoxin [Dethiosulfovibrio sp. F2B]|uniref:type II toxin-antitoxin system RelB/DinJ family antitoxin n=1 Tax=Dethiosulfovibrio faecalis TaxID=2720018 RepID=UPI001F22ADE1|nr:type II toxin-antitoxin system RelB/DinJ family antitoxin [Dethiosulfovibrio faecalis]MCF4150211.1 type II toxin-antitoxin system RelB/DinJ family antitoxin [Dethiosulfovibrio faecalis]